MKRTILLTLLTTAILACGPSKEEIAKREKEKMDSVVKATEEKIAREKAIQDSINAFNANQEVLKQQLVELKAQLKGEQSKLDDIGNFQFLRTADEKAQQLKEQTKVVEEIKLQIEELEKEIAN